MSDSINNINWYPGHMSKAKRQMTEELKLVDIIIELVDARIPYSSKNPELRRLVGTKPVLTVLSKSSLAAELHISRPTLDKLIKEYEQGQN